MNRKLTAKVVLIAALTGGIAFCGKKDLEDETQDVIEQQNEAAQTAAETPYDTAKIIEEGKAVEREQKDVQKAMQEKLEDEGLTSSE